LSRKVTVRAYPSLAMIKYWGKKDEPGNIPATSSLAVTLDSLWTESHIERGEKDLVILNGTEQDPERFRSFFEQARGILNSHIRFKCQSDNHFPTAAGLASSSSGFAALALGINALTGGSMSPRGVSSLARVGSASAARAVFGGFTVLPAGAVSAVPLHEHSFWPDLRVIVVSVSKSRKTVPSRPAMEHSKQTSPFYDTWVKDSEDLYRRALNALEQKDLNGLGPLIRMSYLRMFSTMFSSAPPLIYWLPASLGIIHLCSQLREEGIGAWETMDAGPQVKIFCLKEDGDAISRRVAEEFPECTVFSDQVGSGPVILENL